MVLKSWRVLCHLRRRPAQVCVTGRYLPHCDALASDERAREGAASVLRSAQHEAMRHLSVAEKAFRPYITTDAAAARAAGTPVADTAAPGGAEPGDEPGADGSDDECCSDDEGCGAIDLGGSDSSDSGEDSEDDC